MLVTARFAKANRCFLQEVMGRGLDYLLGLLKQPAAFFDERRFMPLDDFKKSVGRHFAITMENIDEDPFVKASGRSKTETPSVRSFSSFMLQHQNLWRISTRSSIASIRSTSVTRRSTISRS
jgi:hypothetical protein